jgi:hypothetical protein
MGVNERRLSSPTAHDREQVLLKAVIHTKKTIAQPQERAALRTGILMTQALATQYC